MGSDKRERQKEGRRARLEAEALAWRRQQRNRRIVGFAIVAFVAAVVVGAVNLLANDDEEATEDTIPTTTADPSLDSMPTVPITAPPAGEAITGETPCPAADGSSPRTTSFEQPPPMCIDASKTYEATVGTDLGEFVITLDAVNAPKTVNNFVVLARYHFFDGVLFHRIIPGFVIQGGDANGNPPGTGDPGYGFEDELPDDVSEYVRGSVAMANSGPNTNGSQWFVWMGPDPLPAPDYSLFGQVTEGLEEVLVQIEAAGTAEGTPQAIVPISSVTIEES